MADKQPPTVTAADLLTALKALPPEDLKTLLVQSGAAPTTIGMSPEQLQMIIGTLNPAIAMREAYKLQRKENPNYPEQSVFHPRGKFDHEGIPLKPKATFKRPTFFMDVRLGGELETEDEIELCNRFTQDRLARNGKWKAIIKNKGELNEELHIEIPSKTMDDRMENAYPFAIILRELLEGAAAVNQETLIQRIADLEAKLANLEQDKTQAVA